MSMMQLFLLEERLTLKILKVINNNVVSAFNDRGKEVVVMGRGIGFKKTGGEEIDDNLVEKIFSMPEESTNEFEQLLKDIPYEYISVANKIIIEASAITGKRLNKNIYITLTDHLNFAITRAKENIVVTNALLWEIKRFYRTEFAVGSKALEIIHEELGVELPEDEAGFFALHVVNAEMDGNMNQVANMPDVISDIVNIVGYTFGYELNPEGRYYDRFITHLKFLFERIIHNEESGQPEDVLNDVVRASYPKSHRCAVRIKDYLKARMQYEIDDEELTYLTIHIERITRK